MATAFAADAGASPRQLEDIALAVSEALTNAVLHAYPSPRSRGEMAVYASVHDRVLEIVISDEGIGISSQALANTSGFGHDVIAQVSDEFTVSSSPHWGLRAHLTFELE